MNKFYQLGIVFILFFCSNVVHAHITISPFFLNFDANKGQRTELVRFTNTNHQKTTYRIGLIDYKQLENGRYQEIKKSSDFKFSAKPYLKFAPHETTLDPMQTQVIRVQRKAMAAAQDGEYVSHLYVQEMPSDKKQQDRTQEEGLHIHLKALYRMSIPIIIEKGDLHVQAKIQSASYHEKGMTPNPEIRVVIQRKGSQSFLGSLLVKQGKKTLGVIKDFRIFATTPKRILTIPLSTKIKGPFQIFLMEHGKKEPIDEKNL